MYNISYNKYHFILLESFWRILYFIGDKNSWGMGIGILVTEEIIKIGIENHHLNRIFLTVSESNIGRIKAYQKAGFVKEGQMRKVFCQDDEYHS